MRCKNDKRARRQSGWYMTAKDIHICRGKRERKKEDRLLTKIISQKILILIMADACS
jgi:hypothetical protein